MHYGYFVEFRLEISEPTISEQTNIVKLNKLNVLGFWGLAVNFRWQFSVNRKVAVYSR